jgi:UDP-N-acetylmuramoylalanine--D-glutamate ligase
MAIASGNNLKKIGFIGFGLENQALLAWFKKHHAPAEYTVCDARPDLKKNYPGVSWRLGKNYLKDLSDFEIVYRSPGCPLTTPEIKTARRQGTIISSAMNLFFELAPTQNIIGVSGSKGKGTTTSLIYDLLKNNKKQVFLGGNIGVAPFTFLDKLNSSSWVVLELSSFQLEDLAISPRYAILTNLFHEHLKPADPNNPNYHKNFAAYRQAKLNIASHPQNKYLIANGKLAEQLATEKINGQIIPFGRCAWPSRLAGEFNQENIAAVETLAGVLKIKESLARRTVKNFIGLPHRLELIGIKNGVRYYDNSFSTTPESTIADLESFPGAIILLGGADKGASFKKLAAVAVKQARFAIIFTGQAAARLHRELERAGFKKSLIKTATSMEQAVHLAAQVTKPGDTVLLSTACASFGLFKNYKERGDLFKKYVTTLPD